MAKARDLFAIRGGSSTQNYAHLAYRGLLYPNGELFFAYGEPCVHLEISVNATPTKGVFAPFACIKSIDDAGCSIYGAECTREEAEATVHKVKEWFMTLEFQCPSKEELTEAMRPLGMFVQVW